MELRKNRPVITEVDHPATVERALRASIPHANAGKVALDASTWDKTAQDAYESLQDAFYLECDDSWRPDTSRAKAVLYMTTSQLETALVAYSLENVPVIPDEQERTEESARVDELLISLDGLLGRPTV